MADGESLLDDLQNLLDRGGDDQTTTATTTGNAKPTPTSSTGEAEDVDDVLAEINQKINAPRLSTSSRPATPRTTSATAATQAAKKKLAAEASVAGSSKHSEEKAYDNPKEQQQKTSSTTTTTTTTTTTAAAAATGGSWWGGLTAMASAARKQAEAAVKEIQSNEEALKWAEQVKGNYGALRGFGGELRSKALPTFTNLLHTIAPPISQHERLQIHITHDFQGFPSLDPLVYQTFSRVMSQVEGGDLMVIQRGSESSPRQASDTGYTGSLTNSTGWSDGPWWRQSAYRSLGSVNGLPEGTKLVHASAESFGKEFFSSRGGIEEAAKQATTSLSESNPVRSSDIFVGIQAINHTASADHFGGSTTDKIQSGDGIVVDGISKPDELISFAVYLHDPVHSIEFSTLSQTLPRQWISWIEAGADFEDELPEVIASIIEAGGIDPREWVAEWIEEALSLAVGVVAQRYVARRMGVAEGGIGRGKRREEVVESGGGEAARAI